jgi:long-chain acyl-CoA synthetase
MQDVRPTYLVFVPQLLALFWGRIEEEARNTGKYEKLMKGLFIAKYLPSIVRKFIFRNVHAVFGGKLRFVGCGGAPLNYHIGNNFVHMGFRILEGYGATEVTALATANDGRYGVGNVGKPAKGVEVKLDEDGQILIKSDCISKGYYQNEQKTKEVFRDGWYHTGDIGKFSEDGVLHIVGRNFFKIVLASGEKIYVEDIEKIMVRHPLIKDACVIGLTDGEADKIHAIIIPKDPKTFDEHAVITEINSWIESKQQIMSHSLWERDDFPHPNNNPHNPRTNNNHNAATSNSRSRSNAEGGSSAATICTGPARASMPSSRSEAASSRPTCCSKMAATR